MKPNKKLFLLILAGAFLTGCAASNKEGGNSYSPHEHYYGDSGSSSYSEDKSTGGDPEGFYDESTHDGEERNGIPSGQLTCKALDDNANYESWESLVDRQSQNYNTSFADLKRDTPFKAYNRLSLTINNGKFATVEIKGTGIKTKVDNFHKAYLFPENKQQQYEVEISYVDDNDFAQKVTRTVKDGDTIDLEKTDFTSNNLELMFVVDATGSMGDEMDYLKAEIDNVIGTVKEKNANANIRLATMVYRDQGDEYVTRYSDFSTDIEMQRDWLSGQYARGGGDTPEAVHTALKEAIEQKQWSPNATKLLFHVADAPAHNRDLQQWNSSVLKAAEEGIKIISVASSGIGVDTEYYFRSQSILTGGQYVFLTNHSGIGNPHKEAETTENLTVEYLNSCLIRLIDGYFTGNMREPIAYNQQQ